MNRPDLSRLTLAGLCLFSTLALGQECPKPSPRPTPALQVAIGQDEAMAQSFEIAATNCTTESLACDDARSKCGAMLTSTLQKQVSFDEGAFLRDMLIAYQGQQYRMATPIAAGAPLTDVSCNADANTLKSAAARRRQQAERRKLMLAEYPRWVTWVGQQHQACLDRNAAEKARVDAQSADAAKLLAAAELARKAEELKQDQARAAEKALREKAEAEARAKEDQLRKQKEAEVEAKRQQQAAAEAAIEQQEKAKREAADRAEAEKRARETAEETAARQKVEADEARVVAEREGRKKSAEQKQAELIEKERLREEDAKARREQARAAAETAHKKKVEELKRNLELSEADRNAQLAEVDKQYELSETKRREQVEKEIAAAGQVDRSDERLNGALSGHGAAGYFSLSDGTATPASAPLAGGQVTIRQGFWATAPASGLASGVEIRATGLFLTAVSGSGQLIQVSPEFRYWFGRLGLGAAFEWQMLTSTISAAPSTTSTLGLGPTISIAAVDDADSRMFFTVRWMPILNSQYERITGEIEGGYAIFSFAIQGGVIKDSTTATARTGWFAGLSLGARLRW